MKSGTTSLFRYLSRYLQIAPCREDEVCFFLEEDVFDRGIDWYEDLYDFRAGQHCIALEKSGNYTKDPLFPDPQFLAPTRYAHQLAQYEALFPQVISKVYPRIGDDLQRFVGRYGVDPRKVPSDSTRIETKDA